MLKSILCCCGLVNGRFGETLGGALVDILGTGAGGSGQSTRVRQVVVVWGWSKASAWVDIGAIGVLLPLLLLLSERRLALLFGSVLVLHRAKKEWETARKVDETERGRRMKVEKGK